MHKNEYYCENMQNFETKLVKLHTEPLKGTKTTNLAQISYVITNRSDYLRHFRVWNSYFFAKECHGLLSFVLFSI